jgi:CDP-paratose 2-epimerase
MAKRQNKPAVLISGSSGLIGSEAVRFFIGQGYRVVGIDNNMREYFFGPEASTQWQGKKLLEEFPDDFMLEIADIRDSDAIAKIFQAHDFAAIIHTAAQPSHDWAAKEPLTDFTVNANGTLVMLENFRQYAPKAAFIFTSTNKVYGDTPNKLPLVELDERYEIDSDHPYFAHGISETMSIDYSKHSLFGVSKVAADVLVQEYGRYFGLNTVCFRCGCLTGPAHSGTKLHGFLAYLAKCIALGEHYTIFGYKGKQVRDNIHSFDLVNAFHHYIQNPRPGEVYNMGGGRRSNISMLEAIKKFEQLLGKKAKYTYQDENRIGDHIWYISDTSKFAAHYPQWSLRYSIDDIMKDIVEHGHFRHEL